MNGNKEQTIVRFGKIRQLMLLCLMVLLSETAVANELFNSSWYTMSSSVDHMNFNLLLADLRGRDDWVTTGRVKAYSQYGRKGTSLSLFNVWTVDQSNTDEHRIYGSIEQNGALAKITHLKRGCDHLTNGSDASWIDIEDSGDNFPQVHIEFYWAPEMGGKTWYFYFEGKSDEGDNLTYFLGQATCSTYLGRPTMDVKSYSCTRKNSKQLEFSIPGRITETAASGYQWHEGWYNVTFTYTLYSGKKVTQKQDFVCDEDGYRKAHAVNIPANASNFRNLDMDVSVTDAYKNVNGQYYYQIKKTYYHNDVLPTVPSPTNIVAEYRQYDEKIDVNWNSYYSNGSTIYSYIKESVPYVYRMETDESGNPLSGQNWKKLRALKEVGSNKSYSFSDNGSVKANSYYKYIVANVPKAWINDNDIKSADLNNPSESFNDILSRVGYIETTAIDTKPTVDIFNFGQDMDVTDKVALQWRYSRVPGVSGNVTFDVWRAPVGTSDWNKIGSTTNKANPDANTVATFSDADLSNEKVRYDYKVQLSINSGKNVFESDVLTAGLLEGTSLKEFIASKGTHDNSVLLQWTAHHVGTDYTNYDIFRRYVGEESADWMKAYSVSGHSDSYTYEDKTVRPGYYYEYKIEAYSGEKSSESTAISSLTSIGFCQSRGVVSGRISFSTGNMAVEDVRVTLRSADEGDNAVRGYSQRIDGASTGIVWDADSTELAKIFGNNKNYTVQLFVRPDSLLSEGAVIGEIPGIGQLTLGNATPEGYGLRYEYKDDNLVQSTGVTLPVNKYSLLTLGKTGDQLSIQVDTAEVKTITIPEQAITAPFSVGGASNVTDETAFKGNFTEVRVWDHPLTNKERAIYADRVLSGREQGLKLYWPMDEGMNRLVFDASYSNDVPNGRHATVGSNASASVIIPDEEQLSRYGLTNERGEYTIRGIPFVGSGTSYTFTPTKGIHTFSPAQRNGFIGPSSLALNNTDFDDNSSFPMRGKVTYLNTNIPVDSVQFKIDGTAAQNKSGLLVSDNNGEYEISVPIGNHRIEAWKDGHCLTAFPIEADQTHDFMKSETVNFVDSTLVNVTGRVNGGFTDKDEPLGFGRSTNRIGQATVKLSLGREAQSSFNYIVDDHGDGSFGTTPLPVKSATERIASKAWRAAGTATDNSETHYIYIKTDSLTGEFSALLPPLNYKVESITFENDEKGDNARYNNLDFFTQNLPTIDATTTNVNQMQCDSLVTEGGNTECYYYAGKLLRQLRNAPLLTVVQDNMKNGAFGIDSLEVTNKDNTSEKLVVTSYNGDSYSYNYNYPLFVQNETYDMTISLKEEYVNVDTKDIVTEIPADATVHVANEGSISTAVIAEKCELNGKEMEIGEVYNVNSIEATPDEKGLVRYSWIAGLPNLAGEHLRTLSVSAKVDGRTYVWKPDGKNSGLSFVALGGIITGTNFVTGGPDHVDMILRRPPGSTGYATWAVDTIHSNYTTTASFDSHSWGGGAYVSFGPVIKAAQGTSFFWGVTEIAVQLNHTVTRANITEDTDLLKQANSYTISEAKTTPSGNTYTQRNGDTFIGRATNLLFGKGEAIGLFKQPDGTYKIDQEEAICTGETFSTTFIYSHQYIEDDLLPNWERLIDSYLTHWDGDLSTAPRVPGKMMYYTNYQKGDAAWGKANSDTDFWTKEQIDNANGMPGYRVVNGLEGEERLNACDSVEWCANQIKTWKYWLAQNEEDKIDAFTSEGYFDKNYSIAGGTNVSQTVKRTKEKSKSHSVKTAVTINNETHFGVLFNGAGAYGIMKWVDTESSTNDSGSTDATSESFTWRISDNEPNTALSVDVYKSPSGWSQIFRTRGGQTSNPYEGATYTKYFNPGTQLDEATMRVEKPELTVVGPTEITDVPTGGTAKFNLQLYNASETNSICTYVLETMENSNPNGAQLIIDGIPVSNGKGGRTVKMKGGEIINKQLLVKQSDRSIIDYDDIKLKLRSVNDTSTFSNPVKLRVHFVPSSALVDMAVDHTVLNQELYKKNQGIMVTLKNLDRQDEGLAGVRVRYRRKGLDSWTLAKEWHVNAQGNETPLPDTQDISTAVKFPEDGLYELQAQTFGKYGTSDVTYETDIIEITQDTHGPKLLGMVSPENGQLTYVNRNNMHLRFNEELNDNALSKSDNFRIEGGMNNVVFGESPYPDVAAQLNGNAIETEALYDLSNSDYAFDLWFYRQGDGTIISLGTEDNLLSLSTHDGGKLQARVGNDQEVYDTGTTLPENKWMYMAMDYKHKSNSDDENRLTMLYVTADDTTPNYVSKNQPAKDLDGHGKLSIGGDGMTGMIAGLSIWNSDMTAEQLYETRNLQRASYTPGLVGYWKMDEGHGTQLTDRARSRNMHMESESWYINNENRAAHLDGTEGSPLKVDIATFNPTKTDNFAFEMWFRGNEADNTEKATLLSVDGIVIGMSEGTLKLNTKTSEITLSDQNYLNGNWHHLAFNVRRGTSAIAYIDGEAVKVLPEASVPGISSHYLVVGGELNGDTESNRFTGDVDEIRVWSASLDGQLISDRMYERMDNSYPGLEGYFPMEDIHRTMQGNVVTDFSIANFGEKDSQLKIANEDVTQAVNAPALKPGSTNMRLDDTQFNFTASADNIYFSFPDASLPLMDGNDFTATVNYIKDEHGNNSETVQWMFHADFASVSWMDKQTSLVKDWKETMVWSFEVKNETGQPQYYELSGMPTWMTAAKPVGTITSDIESLDFTISPSAPIGRHTIYLYLTDRLGIRRVLKLNLTVTGDAPEWAVDPDLYESNMTLTGQIYINDKICENTDTKIAAFDDLGLCRGVGSPKYVATRDAYFVDMVLYGAAATELSDGTRELTFKVYDASTGIVHPMVGITIPGKLLNLIMEYKPDVNYGSYDAPVVLDVVNNALEQQISLAKGWTWMSIYVDPILNTLEWQLPRDKNILKRFKNIKSQFAFSTVDKNGEIEGEVTTLEPGKMYKMQLSTKTDFDLVGMALDTKNLPQIMHPGYNWIGTLASSLMSVDEAFADLEPVPGDRVKSRTAFAEFSNKGYWEGTLESIVPGQGYIYHSLATEEKSFHYPSGKTGGQQAPRRAEENSQFSILNSQLSHFQPVDPYLYPDNLNIIAVVKKDGQERNDAEIGAFIGGECRGAIGCNKSHYFLTVMGSSEEDSQKKMELRVWIDGEEYVVDETLPFISDAAYGTLDEPYVLDVNATAIRSIAAAVADDDADWYTLQGFKIGRKPTQPGVYIHHGKTVTIKRKR